MADTSSVPAELEELEHQIDLQTAIVMSLSPRVSSGGDPPADPREMAAAQAQLKALIARREFLLSQGQQPVAYSSCQPIKTEAGPSRQAAVKLQMAGSTASQPRLEAEPPSRQQHPRVRTLPGPKLEPQTSGRSADGPADIPASVRAEVQELVAELRRDVKQKIAFVESFKWTPHYTTTLLDQTDEEVRDLLDFCKARVLSLVTPNSSHPVVHPEIDRIEEDYMIAKAVAEARLEDLKNPFIPGGSGSRPSSGNSPSSVSNSDQLIPTPGTESESSAGRHVKGRATSRKRSFGTHIHGEPASASHQSKTMRMSNQAYEHDHDPFSKPSRVQLLDHDVIDLTGDDDEVYTRLQQEAEAHYGHVKPERDRDEAYARSLPGPHNFPDTPTHGGEATFFGQSPLARRPAPIKGEGPEVAERASGNPLRPLSSSFSRPHMPGAYVSSGEEDSDQEFRRMNGLPQRLPSHLAWAHYQPQSLSTGSSSYSRPGTLQGGAYNTFPGLVNPDVASHSSLSEIIQRTSSYDYVNLLDGDGHPLSGRLGEILDPLSYSNKEEEDIRNLLKTVRPDLNIPESELEPSPEALKFPLFPHQQLALKWMVKMETDKLRKGGILADDMGLGKTISTLSLMLARPGRESNLRTNLIIGPVALVRQWEAEIASKLKPGYGLKVFLMHGRQRLPFEKLSGYDVVLTTYGTIAAEYKRLETYRSKFRKSDAEYGEDKVLQSQCPLLHSKSRFWRIILDEAQCVKNHITQGAKAVHALRGEYRWCLSGTPMMNGAHELMSLFVFLRVAPYDKPNSFNKAFGVLKPAGRSSHYRQALRTKAMKQLQTVLQAVMLRREKTSLINGKPILELPPKMEETVYVYFSEDERAYYGDLENRSQNQFNKYMRAGTLRKNYSNILVLLLRLRQACCHPNLNFDVEYAVDSAVSADQMLELAEMFAQDVVQRLKAVESFECPICYDAVQDPAIVFPCGHELCGECLSRLTSNSEQDNIQAGQAGDGRGTSAACPQCRGKIDSRKVVNYATFKRVHMPEKAAAEGLLKGDEDSSDDDSDSGSKWARSWETDSDESESESSLEDDVADDDDADEDGNLRDFIVPDDASEDASENEADDDDLDEDLEPPQIERPRLSKGKERAVEGLDDLDSDSDLFVSPTSVANPSKTKEKAKRAMVPNEQSGGSRAKKSKGKGKSKEKVKPHELQQLRKDAVRNKASRKKYMDYLYNNWISSAKVSRCTQLLSEIQEKGEKTLVFSVWTGLLDLLEVGIMRDLGLPVCRYDGSMSRDQRDKAVHSFQNNPRSSIMLVSLRAGNAGLNLTAASQVIIMDPFWNPFIEMQAVDRAHRMGQMRTVKVHRILVKNTIEDKIADLQEQKRSLVKAALNEGDANGISRLSNKELEYLFGIGQR